jgi:hypothetical protein
MKTEPQLTCPSCGNKFAEAMEFCPVCMLRKGFAVCFSRLWVLRRPKLRLHFARPSTTHGSKSRSHWGNALKEPTQNIADKKRVRQEDVDSDYLFVDAKKGNAQNHNMWRVPYTRPANPEGN